MITKHYHALRNSPLGVRLANSSIGRRITQSPLSARITRYTLGSVVAATTSAIVFAALYVAGIGTTTCSVVAFVAGAIPNWILNRRWAWRIEGRVAFGREVVAYVLVSLVTLFITAEATGWTQRHVQSIPAHHGIRVHPRDRVLPRGVRDPVRRALRGLRGVDLLGPQPHPCRLPVAHPGA